MGEKRNYLQPHSSPHLSQVISYYEVAEKLRRGPGENLFRFLAECIQVILLICTIIILQNIVFTGFSNRSQSTLQSTIQSWILLLPSHDPKGP